MSATWDPFALLEEMHESVAVYEPDGTFVYVNATTERITGIPRAKLLGARVWDVFPDGVGNLFHRTFERVRETGRAETFEVFYAPFGGWYRNEMQWIGGRVHVVASDITEQKRAEGRLLALTRASKAFAKEERDPETILALLAHTVLAEVGDGAVVGLLPGEGEPEETIAAIADRALERDAGHLFGATSAGSIAERVIATAAALRLADADIDALAAQLPPELGEAMRRLRPRALVVVPIGAGGRLLGALTAIRTRSEVPYSDEEVRLLEDLAMRAAIAIENARGLEAERRAREEAERAADQTRRLQAITSYLSQPRATREIADAVVRECASLLAGSTAAIWLRTADGERLELISSLGYDEPARFATLPLDEESPITAAVREGRPIYTESAQEYAARFPSSSARLGTIAPPRFASACIPLRSADHTLGGLAFAFQDSHHFSANERTFLEVLASQCAHALDRTRLLQQEQSATAALAEANETLQAVVAASPAAIILLDLDGTVRLWNPGAERIFGWTAEEALGRLTPVVLPEHYDDLRSNLARVARGEAIVGYETRRQTRDRGTIDIAMYAAPVRRPNGETQCLSVTVDVTDRKRSEAAARAADRRKDEFLAMLGHELRNPLAPILTALEVMNMRDETSCVREREVIERQTRHLVRLVDDLLDLARITRGKLVLEKHRVDLGAIVAHAMEMASPLFEERRHRMIGSVPRGTLFVDGDETRLAQVFHNILMNAAKYTPPGGEITVRATAGDQAVTIDVEDNGDGIPEELLGSIFDPFVQGERKVQRAQGGLGIGLALVGTLVELHGGTVEAQSDGKGRGSRFVVRLPRSSEAAATRSRRAASIEVDEGARRRVLLVDDNDDAADVLADLLRLAGHEVMVAHDGPTALDKLPAFQPEIALLDIGLPVMDGYDLARRIHAEIPLGTPRLVALTGYGQEHDRRRSEEAGFAKHLVKPVRLADVLAAIGESAPRK